MRPRNCDTCAYCDRYRTQAPCNACMDNPTGGYIRWVDPSEAERTRCLEVVEQVCATVLEYQMDLAEDGVCDRRFYLHGAHIAKELMLKITKQIEAAPKELDDGRDQNTL